MGWTTERARVAALASHGAASERIEDGRRDLRASVAEEYITRLVAQAPPLTAEQRSRLAALLLAPAGNGG